MSLRTLVLAPLAVLALAASACSSGSDGGTEPAGDAIAATLQDSSIELAAPSAPAGNVSFDIRNDGSTVHEFEVLRTDAPADELPVDSGVVQTSADGIEIVDEIEEIAPGTNAELSVDVEAGPYVIICNVAGHYESGMSASFTVT